MNEENAIDLDPDPKSSPVLCPVDIAHSGGAMTLKRLRDSVVCNPRQSSQDTAGGFCFPRLRLKENWRVSKMFKILKTTENNLTVIPGVVDGAWVHVVNPTGGIRKKPMGWEFPKNSSLLPGFEEKPHIEQQAGSTLILLRMPYYRVGEETHLMPPSVGYHFVQRIYHHITRYHNPLLEMEEKKNRPFSTDRATGSLCKSSRRGQ